jgi:hypothetical protein
VSAALLGCDGGEAVRETGDTPGDSVDSALPESAVESIVTTAPYSVVVRVTLDGAPIEGAMVMQGGGSTLFSTDADGVATLQVDPTVPGDQYAIAEHPDARIGGAEIDGPTTGEVSVALVRFDPSDNPDYAFRDPGPEDHTTSTSDQCAHCHITLHHEWYESPHRQSASNPVVQDVYQGIAQGIPEESCAGKWASAEEPGTGSRMQACHVAEPVSASGTTGACADCHAPGIDGEPGGRDLLDATGFAYEYGVHCDVCHHVESVREGEPPGVAGWLHVVRPSEESPSPVFGEFWPLTFGPYIDVLNPNMGSVYRDLFHEAAFCGGCHQQEQEVLVADSGIDLARWPSGLLPIHTTFAEWQDGPMNPGAPCQSCHMPPKPDVGNSIDLHNQLEGEPGIAYGWQREPGAVRAHAWWGPRQPEGGMLGLAAAIFVEREVVDGELVAQVTVANVGPGHAIPTGEPLRNLVLAVEATCDGNALPYVGGDVVPSFGGAVAIRESPDDLLVWSEAESGMVLHFLRREGWVDYQGYGPFGDGSFDAEAKGLPEWAWLGDAAITAVDGDGNVTLDGDDRSAEADAAILGWSPAFPGDGASSEALAGTPGFAFARVLVGADGTEGVPHHLAVDVRSDNRILPASQYTSEHRFLALCDDPVVHAVLVHRAFPWNTAQTWGWPLTDSVMDEVWR